jgi:hypothetical protein
VIKWKQSLEAGSSAQDKCHDHLDTAPTPININRSQFLKIQKNPRPLDMSEHYSFLDYLSVIISIESHSQFNNTASKTVINSLDVYWGHTVPRNSGFLYNSDPPGCINAPVV